MIVSEKRKTVSSRQDLFALYNQVMQYLYARYRIIHIAICNCGAITFEREHDTSWSVSLDNAHSFFPELPSEFFEIMQGFIGEYSHCNHCVNHWGLDLCACGSGEDPEECEGGFTECGLCSQYVREASEWKR